MYWLLKQEESQMCCPLPKLLGRLDAQTAHVIFRIFWKQAVEKLAIWKWWSWPEQEECNITPGQLIPEEAWQCCVTGSGTRTACPESIKDVGCQKTVRGEDWISSEAVCQHSPFYFLLFHPTDGISWSLYYWKLETRAKVTTCVIRHHVQNSGHCVVWLLLGLYTCVTWPRTTTASWT